MEHFATHKLSKTSTSLPSKVSDSIRCGSASWITNGSGTPVQHLQYMPYGEPLVNERTFSYNERFTFTGKTCSPLLHYHFVNHANSCGNAIANSLGLLHAETGFSYFGARYYDSDILTGWLSVDPMAYKYPGLSPYAYCAWNPVRLVDPDGEDSLFFGLLQYQGKAKFVNSNVGDAQKIGNFHVVPFYDNNNNLIGYNAGRYHSDGSYETEYQMEPNDIDVFSENNQLYEFAANLAYCAGEPDWSYVACGNNIASGNIEGALSEIGKMWTTSLSDPSFYIATTLSILSLDNSSAVRQVMRNIKSIESNGGNIH